MIKQFLILLLVCSSYILTTNFFFFFFKKETIDISFFFPRFNRLKFKQNSTRFISRLRISRSTKIFDLSKRSITVHTEKTKFVTSRWEKLRENLWTREIEWLIDNFPSTKCSSDICKFCARDFPLIDRPLRPGRDQGYGRERKTPGT